ncbi:unnamed protein product [Amoebophrya sp. A120]|nr:unnamed protein product [Amoebophrya sp. A120]|eukprot:GSA120T00000530001.1
MDVGCRKMKFHGASRAFSRASSFYWRTNAAWSGCGRCVPEQPDKCISHLSSDQEEVRLRSAGREVESPGTTLTTGTAATHGITKTARVLPGAQPDRRLYYSDSRLNSLVDFAAGDACET